MTVIIVLVVVVLVLVVVAVRYSDDHRGRRGDDSSVTLVARSRIGATSPLGGLVSGYAPVHHTGSLSKKVDDSRIIVGGS
jgi:hypothetical protein